MICSRNAGNTALTCYGRRRDCGCRSVDGVRFNDQRIGRRGNGIECGLFVRRQPGHSVLEICNQRFESGNARSDGIEFRVEGGDVALLFGCKICNCAHDVLVSLFDFTNAVKNPMKDIRLIVIPLEMMVDVNVHTLTLALYWPKNIYVTDGRLCDMMQKVDGPASLETRG